MNADAEWDAILDPDEIIIWQGAPTGALRSEFGSPFEVAFMMVWGGIPLAAVIANPGTLLLGVPALFLAIALWFFVGQHFWAAFMRRRTFYSLSNRRAFIAVRGLTKRTLNSYPITDSTELELEDRSGGAVWFATGEKNKMFSNSKISKIGFEQLANPREAFGHLRTIQRGEI